MQDKAALEFLDKTLIGFKKASVFEEEKTGMRPFDKNDDAYLWVKACQKLTKDGYLELEETVLADGRSKQRRYRITFDGLFALNKYSEKPYQSQKKERLRKNAFEWIKLIAIVINALVTMVLLYRQTVGYWPLY